MINQRKVRYMAYSGIRQDYPKVSLSEILQRASESLCQKLFYHRKFSILCTRSKGSVGYRYEVEKYDQVFVQQGLLLDSVTKTPFTLKACFCEHAFACLNALLLTFSRSE